jgi:nicotinamidase/pyrazinamidase
MKALIIVDMTKDNVEGFIQEQVDKIVPNINTLSEAFRETGNLVIFANDSFFEKDFLFKSKMSPHSLRYQKGSEVTDRLIVKDSDLILPKRRFSAFFKTDLDQTLRTYSVDTVFVCGITSLYCVLATALDSVCHDFYTVFVEDATTAHKDSIHETVMDFYRKGPLQPLLEVKKVKNIINELRGV